MKLGKRLATIESMVAEGYDHIWDCCCDHGLLGAALLQRQIAPRIHFVDIVADIMAEVTAKLERFYPQNAEPTPVSQWQTHCIDVASLPLQQFNGKHLVIIAGVGGDLMINFITAIHTQQLTATIDFLLCPVHHQFLLRQSLIQLDYRLQTEILLEENKRFYEVLLVSPATQTACPDAIHPVGSLLWHSETPEQEKIALAYLQKTLSHYRRTQQSNTAQVESIIEAYSAVAVKLKLKEKTEFIEAD